MGDTMAKLKEEDVEPAEWEQRVLTENVMRDGHIKYAAMFGYEDGEIRATTPLGFNPDPKGIKDILQALKGKDTYGLGHNGIALGSGTRVNTPGKLDKGKSIYGSDGEGGGCVILKTKKCVLAVFYDDDPVRGARLATLIAKFMKDQGH